MGIIILKRKKISIMPANQERTWIMVKPDGVQRGLVGDIISRFERKGLQLRAMKLCQPGQAHFEEHYADLSSKGFFAGLVEYMSSGPVCAMVWQGKGVVKTGRKMLGATNPADSGPELSEETFASTSAETSATAPTASSPRKRKSNYGSNLLNSLPGRKTPINSYTNKNKTL